MVAVFCCCTSSVGPFFSFIYWNQWKITPLHIIARNAKTQQIFRFSIRNFVYPLPICRKKVQKSGNSNPPKKDLNCFDIGYPIHIRSINLILIFFFSPISIKYRIGKRHNSEFWVCFQSLCVLDLKIFCFSVEKREQTNVCIAPTLEKEKGRRKWWNEILAYTLQ